ncbi:unnamed protein product [Nesidiocoris tenuis]|uniref:Uncharacterized protein n=1 Tax=Nesidiocoris tenuis TaxID=355587 RepID=A0A6H5HRN9_9HEMI|nr:unnamed protein product [Nesidiocoris tenuis]
MFRSKAATHDLLGTWNLRKVTRPTKKQNHRSYWQYIRSLYHGRGQSCYTMKTAKQRVATIKQILFRVPLKIRNVAYGLDRFIVEFYMHKTRASCFGGITKILRPRTLKLVHFCGRKKMKFNRPLQFKHITRHPPHIIHHPSPITDYQSSITLHPLETLMSLQGGLPARGMSTSSERIAKTPSLAMDPLSSALDMADPLSALANETSSNFTRANSSSSRISSTNSDTWCMRDCGANRIRYHPVDRQQHVQHRYSVHHGESDQLECPCMLRTESSLNSRLTCSSNSAGSVLASVGHFEQRRLESANGPTDTGSDQRRSEELQHYRSGHHQFVDIPLQDFAQTLGQAALAFGLFTRLIHHADLESQGLATLAAQLWKLSIKHGSLDSKLLMTDSLRGTSDCKRRLALFGFWVWIMHPWTFGMSIASISLVNCANFVDWIHTQLSQTKQARRSWPSPKREGCPSLWQQLRPRLGCQNYHPVYANEKHNYAAIPSATQPPYNPNAPSTSKGYVNPVPVQEV